MILLDTNVVSEGLRPHPDANVRRWLDAQRSDDLFLCMPVVAELRYGVELLPAGARRRHLELAIEKIENAFADRTLPFDRAAAHEYGKIVACRDNLGRATGTMDALIAAIAKVHGAVVATRDRRGLDGVGIEIVDPFQPPPG
jgi:predicted nucleic acid-binding protein